MTHTSTEQQLKDIEQALRLAREAHQHEVDAYRQELYKPEDDRKPKNQLHRLGDLICLLQNILYAAQQASRRVQAVPQLEPVEGDQLPPVGSRIFIRHGRDDDAHACIVTGYYVWGDLKGDKRLHRVFVRMVYEGTPTQNARMLCDCYKTEAEALAAAPLPPAEQQAAQKSALGDEGKALAALRYYMHECSGAEPSISVFHRMAEEALEAAEPQPPEEAPVQMPEPISKMLEDCRSRAIDYATCPSPYNNTRMETAFQHLEHQVRQLLAAHAHGITQAKQGATNA